MVKLLSIFALVISGCEVTAQSPEPHKIYWENGDPGNVLGYRIYCGDLQQQAPAAPSNLQVM